MVGTIFSAFALCLNACVINKTIHEIHTRSSNVVLDSMGQYCLEDLKAKKPIKK
jgi:hypothetical protein